MTYPVSPVVIPCTQDAHFAPFMFAFPSFEEQRTGDPYNGAALTHYGRLVELMKRDILAQLGPEWVVQGVEIGGVRV